MQGVVWSKMSAFFHFACLDQLWFLLLGRKDPCEMDSSGGYRLPQVYVRQRCLELWDCHVGSHVIWRETLLGYVQSRCKYQPHLTVVNTHPSRPHAVSAKASIYVSATFTLSLKRGSVRSPSSLRTQSCWACANISKDAEKASQGGQLQAGCRHRALIYGEAINLPPGCTPRRG